MGCRLKALGALRNLSFDKGPLLLFGSELPPLGCPLVESRSYALASEET